MAYRRIHWKDRRVERPRTYVLTPNADGSQTLTDAPGEVTQEGTPISAENLNRAEEALLHYAIAVDMLIGLVRAGAAQSSALTREEIELAIAQAGDDGKETQTAILGQAVIGQVKLG